MSSSNKHFYGKNGIVNAQRELVNKLKEVEALLAKNTDGNKYLLNYSAVSYADALIAPYLVRLYLAIEDENPILEGIDLKNYPAVYKYIQNLLEDQKLSKAFNLDEPVKSKTKKTAPKIWSNVVA